MWKKHCLFVICFIIIMSSGFYLVDLLFKTFLP